MPREVRVTLQTLRVLRIFHKSRGPLAGSEISLKTNLPSGTIYPLLARLETAGYLKGTWEKGDPKTLKRPLKRFYRITREGEQRYLFEASRNL